MTLNDIFQKVSKSKRKKKKTPMIIADIHEKNSLVLSELINSKQIALEIKSLKIGDYLIGPIVIERKTVSDFISSMLNKRLIKQLKNMKKYEKQLLIIEGISKIYDSKANVSPNAIRGFILYILNEYQVPIIFTKDSKDTAEYLIILAKQLVKKKINPTFHGKIPETRLERKKYILEAFPEIGPVTAKKLLKKFKTLENVFNADETELESILNKKSQRFKKLIHD